MVEEFKQQAESMQLFLEIHRDMRRQGPGDRESTRRALALLPALAETDEILDIGCGPGAQTLRLAELCPATITALDTQRQYLVQLGTELQRLGLEDRVRVVEGDMEQLDFSPASFDLIWAEGAIYIIGFERGLREWQTLLRSRGCVAVTELTWFRPDPPAELRKFWSEGYPAMQDTDANLAVIRAAGYQPLGHFRLPETAWWDEYYRPLEKRLGAVERRYQHSKVAMDVIAMERLEIEMFRKYSAYYGYAFYVMQRET